MSNFKEKAKEKFGTAKEYVKEHKEDIVGGLCTGILVFGSMLIGYDIGFKYGSDYGISKGCKLQSDYDSDVFNQAMEMNKYIKNYVNEEDK